MESSAEIRSKLSQYRVQLAQVEQLLQLDASNTQFVSLKDDLEKVITLTETLLQQVEAAEAQAGSAGASGQDAGNYSPTAAAADSGSDDDDHYRHRDFLGAVHEEDPLSMTTIRKSLEVGDRVEVSGGDRPYAGYITAILTPDKEYRVKYYEFDAEVTLLHDILHLLPPSQYRASDVTVGMTCQVKYGLDQQYYDATVTEILPHGYRITYTEYGNTEIVPLEYLRPKSVPQSVSQEDKHKKSTTTTGAGVGPNGKPTLIPIPENLKILPTDSEEEKRRKQKKIKAIKNRNRLIEQELAVTNVQQSWQSFVHKKNKRPVSSSAKDTGSGSDSEKETKRPKLLASSAVPAGVRRESMFSSSDAVSSRVGVTNSGKGMTSYGERKRFNFNNLRQQAQPDDD